MAYKLRTKNNFFSTKNDCIKIWNALQIKTVESTSCLMNSKTAHISQLQFKPKFVAL